MNNVVANLLQGKMKNHLFPFFWQHGEDESTLREYMRVIEESGCGAVCVESRPHPDYCGPKWWQDMDIILDEARSRNMKVWILDDSHFPTGYANGAILDAPVERCRQSVYCNIREFGKNASHIKISVASLLQVPKWKPKGMLQTLAGAGKPQRIFDDDRMLGIIAIQVCSDGSLKFLNVTDQISSGVFQWKKPSGNWKLCAVGLSRNLGAHRHYINMMDKESCKVLLDTVYESHYARYKEDFGKTIAGFFSDEPELGNGLIYSFYNSLGISQDLPWSRDLEDRLKAAWGTEWVSKLPLLWLNDVNPDETADVRYTYMDFVTRLVESNFSMQLGDWCAEHAVQYIGHVIEDNNQHARTGTSLGHYFRGLSGQHMAGIDDIGGQVLPQCEDAPIKGVMGMPRDGEFYHFVLAKLGASHAAIDPRKQGRAMCEIFGNYGWASGVQMQKYLVDHFLVRGINEFVPHAFSPKEYPDPDCPPHFYAHGHNPQYRHFGALMRYTNRMCEILSGGHHVSPVALLYHGEAEWTGDFMMMQKPARVLTENQIEFDIIPMDVFSKTDHYRTKMETGLKVNTQEYKAMVIPMMEFIPAHFAMSIEKLIEKNFPVIFVESLPKGVVSGSYNLNSLKKCPAVSLENLATVLEDLLVPELQIVPKNNMLRVRHYQNGDDIFVFVNEGTEIYQGSAIVPAVGNCFVYDAWNNQIESIDSAVAGEKTKLSLCIEPNKSVVVVFAEYELIEKKIIPDIFKDTNILTNWKRSLCTSKSYPNFSDAKQIKLPEQLAKEYPKFSGFVRYETQIDYRTEENALLEITNASEGLEVFVNGKSAGIQIVPPYRYDITNLLKAGTNTIVIEVATTLERERSKIDSLPALLMHHKVKSASGITGEVMIKKWKMNP